MGQEVLVAVGTLFFLLCWSGILNAIAWMGGWWHLAREFPDDALLHDRGPVRRRRFQSGSFGLMNYNSALTIGVYEQGLRVAALWPFRPGHPPLFIPWSELVDARAKRVFPFVQRLQAQIGAARVTVLLPTWVEQELTTRCAAGQGVDPR